MRIKNKLAEIDTRWPSTNIHGDIAKTNLILQEHGGHMGGLLWLGETLKISETTHQYSNSLAEIVTRWPAKIAKTNVMSQNMGTMGHCQFL